MRPSHHALGKTRATMGGTEGRKSHKGETTPKTRPYFRLQAAILCTLSGVHCVLTKNPNRIVTKASIYKKLVLAVSVAVFDYAN